MLAAMIRFVGGEESTSRRGATSCEDRTTFCGQSYAHSPLYKYVHLQTHACANVSHPM